MATDRKYLLLLLVLLCLPAVSSATFDFDYSPSPLYETNTVNFSLVITPQNETIYYINMSALGYSHQLPWTAGNILEFLPPIEAPFVSSNTVYNFTVIAVASNKTYNETFFVEVLNDDSAPIILPILPVNGTFTNADLLEFSIDTEDNETGIKEGYLLYESMNVIGISDDPENISLNRSSNKCAEILNISVYPEGRYINFYFKIWNNVNLFAETPWYWIRIDRTAPAITINSPEDNITISKDLEINFTVNDAYSNSLNCSLLINSQINDSKIVPNGNHNFSVSLPHGSYNWLIQCKDLAGNIGENGTRIINIDKQISEPAFSNIPSNLSTYYSSMLVEMVVEFNEDVTVNWVTLNEDNNTINWTFGQVFRYNKTLDADKNYLLIVNATDNYGNNKEFNHTYYITKLIPPPSPPSSSTSSDTSRSRNGFTRVMPCNWTCTKWSNCSEFGLQTRTCESKGNCTGVEQPLLMKPCRFDEEKPEPEAPVITEATTFWDKVKSRWYFIPAAAGLVSIVSWLGMGKSRIPKKKKKRF